jgi:hypothetical protein
MSRTVRQPIKKAAGGFLPALKSYSSSRAEIKMAKREACTGFGGHGAKHETKSVLFSKNLPRSVPEQPWEDKAV